MKKLVRTLTLALALSMSMAVPAMAQRHGNNGNTRSERTHATGHSNRQTSVGTSGRPGLNGGNTSVQPTRPGTGNNGNNGNHNGNFKPGNGNNGNHNGNFKPGNGNNGNHNGTVNRPGATPQPQPGFRPGNSASHRPGIAPSRPAQMVPAHRPNRPVMMRPSVRPVPPVSWRPRPGIPVIRGILGLTFGVAFNASLDYLYNSGYSIDGYADNTVYLRNVAAMNYVWPDAALYYNGGLLDASSFYYSTPVRDIARFNAVRSNLISLYGAPVMSSNAGGMMSATWFGGNNGYITLSFGANGMGRFLTTLTFGQ